jgi:predicted RNase H-like HicB family nuclease
MKIHATFAKDGKWWVAWTEDVPGALTQGRTLEEARGNLIDAVREMRKPADLRDLPKGRVVVEELTV